MGQCVVVAAEEMGMRPDETNEDVDPYSVLTHSSRVRS
jgi:hypothetical protein